MIALHRNILRRLAVGVALCGLGAGAAHAQDPSQVSILVRLGAQSFDKASSIEPAAFVGLDAMYGVNSWLSIGPAINLGRPQTTGEHFISSLTYGIVGAGDTTTFYNATQPVAVLDGALNARVKFLGGSKIQPYATGGVGGYIVFMDPQTMRGDKRMSGMAFNAGAGLLYQFSDRAGVALDLRSNTYTSYDRTELDPRDNLLTQARVEGTLFREDFPLPPATKSTVTNFSLSIGFQYVPSFLGGGGR
jgi:opacity protein-like surface antigen